MRLSHLLLTASLCSGGPLANASGQEGQAVDTSRAQLLDHQRLRLAMTRLASEHAELVTRLELGTSREGLKIDALRIAAGELGRGRPGILVVANIDGPRVYTSGVALELARMLARRYGEDERVTELLDGATIYVVPRANPDSAEWRFRRPLQEVEASGRGFDNDRDGRSGENGPADVNGDGYVSVMRVPDPEGEWIADPTAERALKKADSQKGERGKWRLEREARDTDGDEKVAEDPARDVVVNRNFAAQWQEHEPSAGLFPTDEPEVRALCEFVMGRADIQLVLVYGEQDNLVKAPESVADDAPTRMRVPQVGVRESDAKLLAEIGRRYVRITGNEAQGSGDGAGSFQTWCYDHRGLTTLSLALWSVPIDTERDEEQDEDEEDTDEQADEAEREEAQAEEPPEPSDDAKRLAWADENAAENFHLGWTPFNHPELGPVEIGGFRPYALIEPVDDERVRIADQQFEFLLSLGELLARVELVDARARDLGGGLLRVRATLENPALLPLFTTWGRRTRTARPAKVRLILPAGAQLLAGEQRVLVSELAGMGGRRELEWLVQGVTADKIGIEVETEHAGSARAIPEVK